MPNREREPENRPAEPERGDLLEHLLEELARRALPEGAWLVEIARARQTLAHVDDLLRRLEKAIIENPEIPLVLLTLEELLTRFD